MLLRAGNVEFADSGVEELLDRTEGWPAGLALVGRSHAGGSAVGRQGVGASGRYVSEYLQLEHLSRLERAA
jgi:ATP/maltotriose-dependent transcriptional regulator MalT